MHFSKVNDVTIKVNDVTINKFKTDVKYFIQFTKIKKETKT